MKRISVSGIRIVFAMATAAPVVFGQPDTRNNSRVNCQLPGRRLSEAIERARPGDVIEVQGTCRERVTIKTGPLTIDGGGDAVLDGSGVPPNRNEFNGLLTVDGAQGIVIRRLTIRNSTAEGILGVRGASMVLQDTVVTGNTVGIAVSNSSSEVIDSSIRRNTAAGIDAFSSSTLIFRGLADISNHPGGTALTLNGNSLAEIRGGHVRAE